VFRPPPSLYSVALHRLPPSSPSSLPSRFLSILLQSLHPRTSLTFVTWASFLNTTNNNRLTQVLENSACSAQATAWHLATTQRSAPHRAANYPSSSASSQSASNAIYNSAAQPYLAPQRQALPTIVNTIVLRLPHLTSFNPSFDLVTPYHLETIFRPSD